MQLFRDAVITGLGGGTHFVPACGCGPVRGDRRAVGNSPPSSHDDDAAAPRWHTTRAVAAAAAGAGRHTTTTQRRRAGTHDARSRAAQRTARAHHTRTRLPPGPFTGVRVCCHRFKQAQHGERGRPGGGAAQQQQQQQVQGGSSSSARARVPVPYGGGAGSAGRAALVHATHATPRWRAWSEVEWVAPPPPQHRHS